MNVCVCVRLCAFAQNFAWNMYERISYAETARMNEPRRKMWEPTMSDEARKQWITITIATTKFERLMELSLC